MADGITVVYTDAGTGLETTRVVQAISATYVEYPAFSLGLIGNATGLVLLDPEGTGAGGTYTFTPLGDGDWEINLT